MSIDEKKWDVFVSHASEDKDRFVRPLAESLKCLGASIWYDEFSLTPGDSLSRSIDKGLAISRYGLVVISHSFVKKHWTEYELRGLVAREVDEDKVIIPIWLGITRKEVVQFSPSLADKIAIVTEDLTAKDVSIQLLRVIRPDIYYSRSRNELNKLTDLKAVADLQDELERAQNELKETKLALETTKETLNTTKRSLSIYRCPTCDARLTSKIESPVDESEKYWDIRETYACGYQLFGGSIEQLCPSDPKFPTFDEYELKYEEYLDIPLYKWKCTALPKTEVSKKYIFSSGYGDTQDEAKKNTHKEYLRYIKKEFA